MPEWNDGGPLFTLRPEGKRARRLRRAPGIQRCTADQNSCQCWSLLAAVAGRGTERGGLPALDDAEGVSAAAVRSAEARGFVAPGTIPAASASIRSRSSSSELSRRNAATVSTSTEDCCSSDRAAAEA